MELPLRRSSARIAVPTSDDDPRSSPAAHTRWLRIPYKEAAYVLSGAGALVILVVGVFFAVRGIAFLLAVTAPHRSLHAAKADARDGSRVVRPFFAPVKKGGVEAVSVGVSVFFREGVLPDMPDEDEVHAFAGRHATYGWGHINLREDERFRTSGEDGFVRNMTEANPRWGGIMINETRKNPWEEVWKKEMLVGSLQKTKQEEVEITLPGRIVQSLVLNPFSRLAATFTLLPASSLPSSGTSRHHSTRPVEKYGSNGSWPLWIPSTPPSIAEAPVFSFLENGGAGYDLLEAHHQGAWRSNFDEFAHFINTRSWITVANDYPVYKLDSFRDAQQQLKDTKNSCSQHRWIDRDCLRMFNRDGHFENLLEQTQNGETRYSYGPFLTTRLTASSPKDMVELPPPSALNGTAPDKVEDFTFTWKLTYSALSPAKLALADEISDPWSDRRFDPSMSASEAARQHDFLELMNSLIGHSFNPNSHPVARTFIGYLAMSLRYLTVPLIFHYWLTRRTSTGLVLAWWFAQSVSDLVYHIVHSLTNIYRGLSVFPFVSKIIGFVVLILAQFWLLTGIEFRLHEMYYFPTDVRFRRASTAERASSQVAGQFDWRLKTGLSFLLFLLLRFGPSPPQLISAPEYVRELIRVNSVWDEPSPVAIWWLRTLNAWQSTVWFMARASQIHLNHAHRTFASNHPLTSYLLFAALVLSHLTTLGVRLFGRSESMAPFTIWDVLTLAVEGTLAVQARRLPVVPQREGLVH
ncbi:hypothetical protein JCM8097_004576 [Rhodosporidiobolus ruineniae]